jgi:hypothetical protein
MRLAPVRKVDEAAEGPAAEGLAAAVVASGAVDRRAAEDEPAAAAADTHGNSFQSEIVAGHLLPSAKP